MDATASGAQGIAGRNELRERSPGVRTNGAANCFRLIWPDRYEVRREFWRGRRGRRNRVVLTPRRWRQVLRRCVRPNRFECICDPQSDGGKKARSPGRSRISRNPSRRESRMIRFTCGLLVRFLCTTAGAIGARLSLRPSFSGRVKLNANLGRMAPREREDVSAEEANPLRRHRPA